MPRRHGGLLEALFELYSRLPWWFSLSLALGSYKGLGWLAAQPVPELTDLHRAPAVIAHLLHGFAWAGQFILPFVFSIGAMTSILVALRGKQLYRRVSKEPDREGLNRLSWREFEILMLEWFRQQGYAVQDTELGADGGVDIVLRRDGNTYLVQCKHWRAWKVGVNVVRELLGVMTSKRAAGGFIVTSGRFTEEARQFAGKNGITLMDGNDLSAILRKRQARQVDESILASTPPSDSQRPSKPACPRCGADMVRRQASRGPSAGAGFWGCSRFPQCRGTRPIQ